MSYYATFATLTESHYARIFCKFKEIIEELKEKLSQVSTSEHGPLSSKLPSLLHLVREFKILVSKSEFSSIDLDEQLKILKYIYPRTLDELMEEYIEACTALDNYSLMIIPENDINGWYEDIPYFESKITRVHRQIFKVTNSGLFKDKWEGLSRYDITGALYTRKTKPLPFDEESFCNLLLDINYHRTYLALLIATLLPVITEADLKKGNVYRGTTMRRIFIGGYDKSGVIITNTGRDLKHEGISDFTNPERPFMVVRYVQNGHYYDTTPKETRLDNIVIEVPGDELKKLGWKELRYDYDDNPPYLFLRYNALAKLKSVKLYRFVSERDLEKNTTDRSS